MSHILDIQQMTPSKNSLCLKSAFYFQTVVVGSPGHATDGQRWSTLTRQKNLGASVPIRLMYEEIKDKQKLEQI